MAKLDIMLENYNRKIRKGFFVYMRDITKNRFENKHFVISEPNRIGTSLQPTILRKTVVTNVGMKRISLI